MDFKKLRMASNKRSVKDPPRFPNVINVYEDQSKGDFKKSLQLEGDQIKSMVNRFLKN